MARDLGRFVNEARRSVAEFKDGIVAGDQEEDEEGERRRSKSVSASPGAFRPLPTRARNSKIVVRKFASNLHFPLLVVHNAAGNSGVTWRGNAF